MTHDLGDPGQRSRGLPSFPAVCPPLLPSPRSEPPPPTGITWVCSESCAQTRHVADCDSLRQHGDSGGVRVPKSQPAFFFLFRREMKLWGPMGARTAGRHGGAEPWAYSSTCAVHQVAAKRRPARRLLPGPPGTITAQRSARRGPAPSPTLVQTPVVASQRVRMDTFCARLSQFTATLVLVAHFTMVM